MDPFIGQGWTPQSVTPEQVACFAQNCPTPLKPNTPVLQTMGTGKNIKHSLAIYIDADWSPLHSLPGEEGPEKARVEPQYPPTYFIKQWLVGSRSLTHISGDYTPFIFYSYHRRIKSRVVDCGKRWEEDTICGSSFPKVVSGGHQQLSPVTISDKNHQFLLRPNNKIHKVQIPAQNSS